MRNSQCNTGLELSAKLNALAPPVFSKETKVVRFKQDTIDGKVEGNGNDNVTIPRAEHERLLKLADQASYDDLTGLLNKRRFEEQLKHDLSLARRDVKNGGSPDNLVVMYFDLNGLKHVNDTYGHETGDDLLKTAGNLIYHFLRRESDTVARIGGDEFAAILPQTDMESARFAAWKLQEGAKHLGVSVAVGMASYKLSVKDPIKDGVYAHPFDDVIHELKSKADTAMYENKSIIKQRVNVAHFYDQFYGKPGAEKSRTPDAVYAA